LLVIPAKAGIHLSQGGIQVDPMRVFLLNQPDLPVTLPILDSLFAKYGRFHGFMKFEPYEPMHVISVGETLHDVIFVPPDALDQVARNSDVKRASSAAA
jgi:hypothetical protein